MPQSNIVVIGSCMIDLICYAKKLPAPGETIHGTNFVIGHGGKGANQCVAASKLGASVSLIARLGDDSFGQEYKKVLGSHGVKTDSVILTPGISSGMAQITVSEKGENQIVIVPGANDELCFDDVLKAKETVLNGSVFLFQYETPLNTTVQTLGFIKEHNKKAITIVNAAPALKNMDPRLFSMCDIFCVNETEAEELCGFPLKTRGDTEKALVTLIGYGCKKVIITLGEHGAMFNSSKDGSEIKYVSAPQVKPVDTTGAGDAFLGALAYYLAERKDLPFETQILRASTIASDSVTRKGTQSSYPVRVDLPTELFS